MIKYDVGKSGKNVLSIYVTSEDFVIRPIVLKSAKLWASYFLKGKLVAQEYWFKGSKKAHQKLLKRVLKKKKSK